MPQPRFRETLAKRGALGRRRRRIGIRLGIHLVRPRQIGRLSFGRHGIQQRVAIEGGSRIDCRTRPSLVDLVGFVLFFGFQQEGI